MDLVFACRLILWDPYTDLCSGRLCDIQGPCYFNPCEQSQTQECIQSVQYNNYTCICQKGWQGKNCTEDVNECTTRDPNEKHQCVAGQGTCRNTNGSYTCDCAPGFSGQYCETDINECDNTPCLHGGVCTDLVNNFTCNCTGTGYEGMTCESDVDECKQSPPVCHHGNCSNTISNFTCICGDRWRGQFCDRENPCYNISCQNGGTCQENVAVAEERCACTADYEGARCEKALRSSSGGGGSDLKVIIGPIVGGIVVIIIIIVVVALLMSARSKRATRGAYSPSAQENAGSRVENGGVLKKPPEERLI
ncbi:protein crumbs-like [Elysia marginata]|uniref:Protein crumbs-like n=1 Tax=Elysia marginata TaxID=1093978 RepID=A0AAV4JIM5_9GAST|nr:protein crumbs-like [Elysia marginata]